MHIGSIIDRGVNNILAYVSNKYHHRNYDVWIFGEWFGKRCSDNVMAFANYVAQYGGDSLQLYWICNEGTDTSGLNSRIKVIDRLSRKAVELQKIAGVAIMNQGYDDFNERGDNYLGNAITVNLWHGVMWKKIGFDSYSNGTLSDIYVWVMKRVKKYALFCSSSPQYTELFSKAFRLEATQAVPSGLPRNEIFFCSDKVKKERDKLIDYLKSQKVNIDEETKIITYMPTFRDSTSESFSFSSCDKVDINDYLKSRNCIIIQKAHEKNISRGVGYGSMVEQRIINIDKIPAQNLLAATDVLITDYSSCFFDFLLLDRPIIHFVYDYDFYSKKDRGLYYSWERVDCGYVVESEDELLKAIGDSIKEPEKYHNKRMEVKDHFMTYENANSCEIIFQSIMGRLREKEE